VIKCGAKQRAALESARELSRELFHAPDRRELGHVFPQHIEIFK